MEYRSFAAQVSDDGAPSTALDIAGQAVRDFNHRSFGYMCINKPGWRYAPDAYTALGELTVLAGGLPQAFAQIITALRHEAEHDLIKVDPHTSYESHPEQAVAAAAEALQRAIAAAHTMYQSITDAQNAINAVAYAGPEFDGR
jgi:hypothetical protein